MPGPVFEPAKGPELQSQFSTIWSGTIKFGTDKPLIYALMRDPGYKWPNVISTQEWFVSASPLPGGLIRIIVEYAPYQKINTYDFDPASTPNPIIPMAVQHDQEPYRYDLARLRVISTGPDYVQAIAEFASNCLLDPISAVSDTGSTEFHRSNLSDCSVRAVSEKSLQISFQLQNASEVSISLFGLPSNEAASILSKKPCIAGSHVLDFDASGLAPGFYLMVIQAGSEQKALKVLVP